MEYPPFHSGAESENWGSKTNGFSSLNYENTYQFDSNPSRQLPHSPNWSLSSVSFSGDRCSRRILSSVLISRFFLPWVPGFRGCSGIDWDGKIPSLVFLFFSFLFFLLFFLMLFRTSWGVVVVSEQQTTRLVPRALG